MSNGLSMRGIWKSYTAGVRGCSATVSVLRDLSLDVSLGEIVGISAATAAGKSTLLMCAAGLLRVDRGTIAWLGGAPAHDKVGRPEGVAYASDRPFPYGFLTVREALEYGAIVRDLPLRDSGQRVEFALNRTGLGAISHRRIDALESAGLARLGIASALLSHPRLLLVDELSPGCDVDTAAELTALLRALANEGAAIVVVGRFALRLASSAAANVRVHLLANGRLEPIANAPVNEVVRPAPLILHARVAESRSTPAARDFGAQ